MSQPTTVWQRLKTGSKSGFDKGWRALDKLGAPVNKLSNKLGSEAFWPTTLDKESDKAARILKSFCKDGFYVEEEKQPEDGPKQKQRVIKKIPEEVIRNAKGLAIFTTMRTGLWVSGAGGSGVLVAKKPDGTWSPPSGIMLHTAGLGFLVGIDIYDCVLVLNTEQAVEAFTKVRCTLGGEVSVVTGPVGVGGVLETEVHKRQSPIFTYMKSRGFYAGVQIDGTIVIERMDENERFYGEELPVKDIMAGKVRHPPYEINRLMETIKAAQGDTNYDETMIPDEPPPGDYEIDDGNMFGVPDKEDPDPYGVLALEKEGMSLREAGTQQRASWEQFSFNPSPTSPIHSIYARNSQDGGSRTISNRNSWRNTLSSEPKAPSSLRNSIEVRSFTSGRSVRSPMADSATQTDFPDDLPSPHGRRGSSKRSSQQSSKGSFSNLPHMIPEDAVLKQEQERAKEQDAKAEVVSSTEEPTRSVENGPIGSPKSEKSSEDKPQEKLEPMNVSTKNGYSTPPVTPPLEADTQKDKHESKQCSDNEDGDEFSDDDYDDEDLQIIEEPVVHSIQTMQPASHAFAGAKMVEVPKRIPPKVPPRNPNRRGGGPVIINSSPPPPADADRLGTEASSAAHAKRLDANASLAAEGAALAEQIPATSAQGSELGSVPDQEILDSKHRDGSLDVVDRDGLNSKSSNFPSADLQNQSLENAPNDINESYLSADGHKAQKSPEVLQIPGGFD